MTDNRVYIVWRDDESRNSEGPTLIKVFKHYGPAIKFADALDDALEGTDDEGVLWHYTMNYLIDDTEDEE